MLGYFFLNFLPLVLIFVAAEAKSEGYRFKLDIGNPNELCPENDYKCKDGSKHFLCEDSARSHARCVCHSAVALNDTLIKTFLEATNGIRNKVAGDLQIANMNLVYWSTELMEMANTFLRLCNRSADECLIIGERKITVSQNTVFFEGELVERWPGRMVRHWYYELGKNKKILDFKEFQEMYKKGQLRNLTQLVNPLVEFVGCGAARLAQGYYIVCYYHPPMRKEDFPDVYAMGDPVTKCSKERIASSKTFTNLCGIDFEWTTQSCLRVTKNIFLSSSCLFVVILLYLL